jgi:hypothetical protein
VYPSKISFSAPLNCPEARGQKSTTLSFFTDREIHLVYYQPVASFGGSQANLSPEKSSDFLSAKVRISEQKTKQIPIYFFSRAEVLSTKSKLQLFFCITNKRKQIF